MQERGQRTYDNQKMIRMRREQGEFVVEVVHGRSGQLGCGSEGISLRQMPAAHEPEIRSHHPLLPSMIMSGRTLKRSVAEESRIDLTSAVFPS